MMIRTNNNSSSPRFPTNSTNNYRILQWNVRSIRARSLDLASILHSEECSIALLSETWLRPGQKFSLPHFNLVRSDRYDGYGGVAIAAHQSIHIKMIPIDNLLKHSLLCQSIDLVGIEAFTNSNNSLFLWSLYIPPSSNPPTALLNSIFQLIGTNSILGGDVNGHHPTWDNNNNINHRGDSIYSSLSNLNLCSLNTGVATRVNRPPFANTAVDITITTNTLFWSLSWHPLEEPHGSDHFPLIIEHHTPSTLPRTVSNNATAPPNLNYSKADWPLFSSHLDSLIDLSVFSNSPLVNYDKFVHLLNTAAKISIPIKRTSSKYPTTSPIWWNSACSEAVKQRSAAFKKYRTSGSPCDFLSYQNICAKTTRSFKLAKKKSWHNFCSTLNYSTSIQYLWTTAKKYKKCVNRINPSHNEEWFPTFCDKVAPPYVPSRNESCPSSLPTSSNLDPSSHMLSAPFSFKELTSAIFSRSSIASGIDGISVILLQNISNKATDLLLRILNDIWISGLIPHSWKQYHVIPIPKPNTSPTAFRPIALSSALCKTVEYIIKIRLDWFLEKNNLIPNNLFGFRRGLGTMECLSSFVGPVYKAFCNKEYLCAAFVDIKGAFDSVHIPTLISCLASLHIPNSVCNFISSLFFQRYLQFSSPSGIISDRSTYRGLPQGSCLSPLLFNVYMSPICLSLDSLEFQVLLYADDIVLFSSNKSLEISSFTLNNALKQLSTSLSTAFFTIAPEKSHFMTFTRRRIIAHPNIFLNNQLLQPSSTVTYLGLILDPKLRWVPHFQYLKGIISRWSNFLRATAGTNWGSHPSCLLKIFNAVIRSKADYGSFLYSSASHSHRKKLNSILLSCLRTTVGALSSSPLASLEVECACPPIELRSRRLAGKFLLKTLSSSNQSLFQMFVSIQSSWSYVAKTLPILASVAFSFSALSPLVYRSNSRLQFYDTPYAALSFFPEITISPNFLCYSPKELSRLPQTLVDSLFNEYILSNFPSFVQIFTDGSVSPNSAGFSFFIPSLSISFADKLHPQTSSFSAECYAIISALQFTFSLEYSSFLILSDSQSCLLAISSDSFLSSLSPLVLIIKSLVYHLSLADKTVKFFWIPSHVGIVGNERADHLAFSTKYLTNLSPFKTPASDFLPVHRKLLSNAWQTKWDSLPPNYATWHRHIVSSIPKHPWFKDLEISRHLIVCFTRLRIGHSLLPYHSFKLNLNSSPLCTRHHEESICDFDHILFNCPSLFYSRQLLFSFISSFGYISPDSNLLLNSRSTPIIHSLIQFINTAGFLI